MQGQLVAADVLLGAGLAGGRPTAAHAARVQEKARLEQAKARFVVTVQAKLQELLCARAGSPANAFTARYKLDVLAAYDAADPGEKGAILRREGLYSSHVVDWRRARDAGALAALAQPRGRRRPDPRDAKIDRLYQEKARLEQELAKARFVVSVQAKLQELLELLSESADSDSRSTS